MIRKYNMSFDKICYILRLHPQLLFFNPDIMDHQILTFQPPL